MSPTSEINLTQVDLSLDLSQEDTSTRPYSGRRSAQSTPSRPRKRRRHCRAISASQVEPIDLEATIDVDLPPTKVSPFLPRTRKPRPLPLPKIINDFYDSDDNPILWPPKRPRTTNGCKRAFAASSRNEVVKEENGSTTNVKTEHNHVGNDAKKEICLDIDVHSVPLDKLELSCGSLFDSDSSKRDKSVRPISEKYPPIDLSVPIEDFVLPSPPSSSDEDEPPQTISAKPESKLLPNTTTYPSQNSHSALAESNKQPLTSSPKRPRKPPLTDTCPPPAPSQDSPCLSFSGQSPRPTSPQPAQCDSKDEAARPSNDAPQRYYTRSMRYVIDQVSSRCGHILREGDIHVTSLIRDLLTDNGQALFTRIYRRRQPPWFRVSALRRQYSEEMNVADAVSELCQNRLVLSSEYIMRGVRKEALFLARQLLPSLSHHELKRVCNSVIEGKKLRRLSKNRLLPALQKILEPSQTASSAGRKSQQMTLSGIKPCELLANAIIGEVGHCILIPDHVLTSLARVHYLFFLEDGHDSPNVLLADIGKTKFADYVCNPSNSIFPSCGAYEDYESALQLEKELNIAAEDKDWKKVAFLGSIAEVEVREFFFPDPFRRSLPASASESNVQIRSDKRSRKRRESDKKDALKQLEHPFLRRFTAEWVYVRACWRSVNALERMGEHDSAVVRLRLLLETDLMPRRRGECVNRLTINLARHLDRPKESLNIILAYLKGDKGRIWIGDRMRLAQRGMQLHKKVGYADAYDKQREGSRTTRKRKAIADVERAMPSVLTAALQEEQVSIRVRKLYGKSLNVQCREKGDQMRRQKTAWHRVMDNYSSDSLKFEAKHDIMGKSVFSSLGCGKEEIWVEQYCLEWYHGKERWWGVHDEGRSVRFIYALFAWECGLFNDIRDVFQTPFQNRPLDLMTEAYYVSRKECIDARAKQVENMTNVELRQECERTYEKYDGTQAIGCAWKEYSCEVLSTIVEGLGGRTIGRIITLLSEDYQYWSGGLPDLTLWKREKVDGVEVCRTLLVEVKSARDSVSDRQKAWLMELVRSGGGCELCKVVEKVREKKAGHVEEELDEMAVAAIDTLVCGDKQDERAA